MVLGIFYRISVILVLIFYFSLEEGEKWTGKARNTVVVHLNMLPP